MSDEPDLHAEMFDVKVEPPGDVAEKPQVGRFP